MIPFEEDDDDPWPDEPEEFDPDSIGPRVDIPEAPSLDGDVDSEVPETFWATVLLVNFGLFAASLGAMIVAFQGRLQLGGFVFLLGTLGLAFSYRRYRNYRRSRDTEGGDGETNPDTDTEDEEAGAAPDSDRGTEVDAETEAGTGTQAAAPTRDDND